jgi:DNA-binding transcriptional LysR family regulator
MLNLNTHQLHVFLTAAETLNFTQAAQILRVSQPSISQHIQALEEHFGQPLFRRSGRKIELTDAGTVLVPLAREMIYLSTHMQETMASIEGDIHGHLIVGCGTSTGGYILPKLLAQFHLTHPQVRVTCHMASHSECMGLLVDNKIQLAITSTPLAGQEVLFTELLDERISLAVPLIQSWADRDEIGVEDFLEVGFILPEEGSELHSVIREALAQVGVSIYQLNSIISVGCLEAIALSISEGLGAGFVPQILINRLVQDKVKLLRVRELGLIRKVYIGRNIRRQATAAQQAFWDYVIDPGNPVFASIKGGEIQTAHV